MQSKQVLAYCTKEGGKEISVTRELAIFFVKREIKNLIHVNRDQGHFRNS